MTAPDRCGWTWPSDRPTRLDDTYRQHRCRLPAGHEDRCTCRYCAELVPTLGGRR